MKYLSKFIRSTSYFPFTVPSNDSCSKNNDIRVVGGSSELEGRVEICYDNQWGTVCDDLWGTSDAMVACRQLGHTSFGENWLLSCTLQYV